ncbi:hypothetical protein PINS_up020377 [Pythium insidiosum]|nr:hypothetical protein PINS_up020377 [Pythium insidiosum]
MSLALLQSCRDVRRRVAKPLVAASEAIALHGAAETLIQRPSLRVSSTRDKHQRSVEYATVEQLMEMMHTMRNELQEEKKDDDDEEERVDEAPAGDGSDE